MISLGFTISVLYVTCFKHEHCYILSPTLLQWSRKSRSLHAKGLEQVLQWLREIKGHYRHFEVEAGPLPILFY